MADHDHRMVSASSTPPTRRRIPSGTSTTAKTSSTDARRATTTRRCSRRRRSSPGRRRARAPLRWRPRRNNASGPPSARTCSLKGQGQRRGQSGRGRAGRGRRGAGRARGRERRLYSSHRQRRAHGDEEWHAHGKDEVVVVKAARANPLRMAFGASLVGAHVQVHVAGAWLDASRKKRRGRDGGPFGPRRHLHSDR